MHAQEQEHACLVSHVLQGQAFHVLYPQYSLKYVHLPDVLMQPCPLKGHAHDPRLANKMDQLKYSDHQQDLGSIYGNSTLNPQQQQRLLL